MEGIRASLEVWDALRMSCQKDTLPFKAHLVLLVTLFFSEVPLTMLCYGHGPCGLRRQDVP